MKQKAVDLESEIRTSREDFTRSALHEGQVHEDPVVQFKTWLTDALVAPGGPANAMVLSTVDAEGMPSSRVMLLRDVSSGGFTFFTNYLSRKGRELNKNPKAALLFFWPALERQVRVQGTIHLLPEKDADDYFASRPFESRVGAWASQQSSPVDSRNALDQRFREALSRFEDGPVPRPPHWGGYVLVPSYFEFWQGRVSRLHDRLAYHPVDGKWALERLMP